MPNRSNAPAGELVDQLAERNFVPSVDPLGSTSTGSALTLTTTTGYLVMLQDGPGGDWMAWCGPGEPSAAVSSLRYRNPLTGTVLAAPVSVFSTENEAAAAYAASCGTVHQVGPASPATRVVALAEAATLLGTRS